MLVLDLVVVRARRELKARRNESVQVVCEEEEEEEYKIFVCVGISLCSSAAAVDHVDNDGSFLLACVLSVP